MGDNWKHLQGLLTFTNNFSFKMCYDVLTSTTNFTDNFSFKMCNYTSAFLRSISRNIKDRFQQFPTKSYLDVQHCGIRTKETTKGYTI